MCRGTTNWEDVYIIGIEKIPHKTQEALKDANRGAFNNHKGIPVDACIGEEIEYLLKQGIVTYSCCCGHGEYHSHVLIDESQKQKVEDMGYNTEDYKWGLLTVFLNTGTQKELKTLE